MSEEKRRVISIELEARDNQLSYCYVVGVTSPGEEEEKLHKTQSMPIPYSDGNLDVTIPQAINEIKTELLNFGLIPGDYCKICDEAIINMTFNK